MIVRGRYTLLEEQHEELEELAAQFFGKDGKTIVNAESFYDPSRYRYEDGRLRVDERGYLTRITTEDFTHRTGELYLSKKFRFLESFNCAQATNVRTIKIPHNLTDLKKFIAYQNGLEAIDLPEESSQMEEIRLEFNTIPIFKIPSTYTLLKELCCPRGVEQLDLPYLPSLTFLWILGCPQLELTEKHAANLPNVKMILAEGTRVNTYFLEEVRSRGVEVFGVK